MFEKTWRIFMYVYIMYTSTRAQKLLYTDSLTEKDICVTEANMKILL